MGDMTARWRVAVLWLGLLTLWQSGAQAQSPDFVFQNDVRVRYEHVSGESFNNDADALTLRLRPSIELSPTSSFSLLAELEAVAGLFPDSRNGFFGDPGRPAIADPEGFELNRLQLAWRPSRKWDVTLGRQRIALEDERFIGTVDFRQNQQTFDAISTAYTSNTGLTFQTGYIWQVNRPIGGRDPAGVFDSESVYAQVGAPTPAGQLSLFHFDLDLDDDVNPRIEQETIGVSLNGRAAGNQVALFWSLILAEQQSQDAEPHFVRLGAALDWRDVSFDLRFEELGTDQAIGFQTPLATLHKFQGATDTFLRTPSLGLRDTQLAATWRLGSLGPLRATRINLQFNHFSGAESGANFGQEIGLGVAARYKNMGLGLAWAGYREDGFGSDTDKVWLTLARRF